MMRTLNTLLIPMALVAAAPVALADAQDYCAIYSKDFADVRTNNVDQWQLIYRSAFDDCLVTYNVTPKPDTTSNITPIEPVQKPQPKIAKPAKVTPVVKPKDAAVVKAKTNGKQAAVKTKANDQKVTVRPAPAASQGAATSNKLTPGSDEWNNYCAGKYSSFNKLSGTYMSKSGKIRRCS